MDGKERCLDASLYADTPRSDTRAFVTQNGRIPVVAAGRPDCKEYDKSIAELGEICEEVRRVYAFNPKTKPNRRGDYASVSVGLSYGGGQTVRTCLLDSLIRV